MILESVVDEVVQRVQQAKAVTPKDLINNRWIQLGVAVAVGYVIGRARKPMQLGAFGKTIATAAFTSLVRTALQAARDPSRMN